MKSSLFFNPHISVLAHLPRKSRSLVQSDVAFPEDLGILYTRGGMDGVSSVWVRRPAGPLGAGQWVKLASFSLLPRKVQKQGPRFRPGVWDGSPAHGSQSENSADEPEKRRRWRLSRCESAVSEDCMFTISFAPTAQGPRVTQLAVMGPGDLSLSLWIPVSPPAAAKVKTTQCWSLRPQGCLEKVKDVLISSLAGRKNIGLRELLAQPFCDMVIKWELWFCFLYISQQVKWGRGSHLWSLFLGQEPCPRPPVLRFKVGITCARAQLWL